MRKITEKELLNMDLHDEWQINSNTSVLRVIGGWIYIKYLSKTMEGRTSTSCTFVPEPQHIGRRDAV